MHNHATHFFNKVSHAYLGCYLQNAQSHCERHYICTRARVKQLNSQTVFTVQRPPPSDRSRSLKVSKPEIFGTKVRRTNDEINYIQCRPSDIISYMFYQCTDLYWCDSTSCRLLLLLYILTLTFKAQASYSCEFGTLLVLTVQEINNDDNNK